MQFVEAAEANGVLVAEAFKFRHHPMHLKAKELIDAGEIGEVKTIRSTFCTGGRGGGPENRRPEMNWRFNKAKGGGSIYDLGCYCIHHARFVFDAEPVSAFAIQQWGIEVDDAMYMLLTFPGERTAQISVGFNSSTAQYAEICGTKGMLRLDRIWNNENRPVSIEKQTVDRSESIEFAPVFQFANQLQHLCDCLTTGQPHRISPENCVHQMKVIDAVRESVETGTWQRFEWLDEPLKLELLPTDTLKRRGLFGRMFHDLGHACDKLGRRIHIPVNQKRPFINLQNTTFEK